MYSDAHDALQVHTDNAYINIHSALLSAVAVVIVIIMIIILVVVIIMISIYLSIYNVGYYCLLTMFFYFLFFFCRVKFKSKHPF